MSGLQKEAEMAAESLEITPETAQGQDLKLTEKAIAQAKTILARENLEGYGLPAIPTVSTSKKRKSPATPFWKWMELKSTWTHRVENTCREPSSTTSAGCKGRALSSTIPTPPPHAVAAPRFPPSSFLIVFFPFDSHSVSC